MNFADKLKGLMKQQNLSQVQVRQLTGIGASSISHYLSGNHEPSKARKRDIAVALGVQENYFDEYLPDAQIQKEGECVNLPVTLAAKLMRKSPKWLCKGLQEGRFSWGYAVKLNRWSYFISSVKFAEQTGIKIPVNEMEQAYEA
mgnify:FL=1